MVCLVAVALVAYDLSLPRALHGITQYDDGAYFGAAQRLSAGVLPYKDFSFVQPPGIAVLLAPLALMSHAAGTRVGLALARMLTGLVTVANATLAASLVRRRGLAACLAAGLALALDPAAFFADRTLLLEPYLVLFCLLAAAAAFSDGRLAGTRRLVLAGALIGVAGAVKTWAILPFLALAAVAAFPPAGRWRRLGAVVGGCAASFGAFCLPFFAAAPGAFVHEVLVTQLERSATRHFLENRVEVLVGLHGISWLQPGLALTVVVAVAVLALAAAGSALPTVARRGDPLEAFCLISAVATAAAVLVSPDFYDHYAYFPAAFGTIVVGTAAGRAARPLSGWLARVPVGAVAGRIARLPSKLAGMSSRRLLPEGAAALSVVLASGAVVAGLALLAVGEGSYAAAMTTRAGDPALAIDLAVPAGSCAISDAPILLVAANRFASDQPGCPAVVDPEGTLLALSPGAGGGSTAGSSPAVVRTWERWLGEATFFVESASAAKRVPWTPALRRYLLVRYARVPDPGAVVYVRRSSPVAASVLEPSRWSAARLASEGLRWPGRPSSASSSVTAEADRGRA